MQVGQVSSAVQCAANPTAQWSLCLKDKPLPTISREGSELQQHQGANIPLGGIAWPGRVGLSQSSFGPALCGIFSRNLASSESCTITCAPETQMWWGLNLPWWKENLGRHRKCWPKRNVHGGCDVRVKWKALYDCVLLQGLFQLTLPCLLVVEPDSERCWVPQSLLHCCTMHFSWDAEESP